MIGICTLCGEFGNVHAHHLNRDETIVVCEQCHAGLHYQRKAALPERIRAKITVMALQKLGHSGRGYGYFATIQMLKSRDLANEEKEFLREAEELIKGGEVGWARPN